MVLTSAPQLLRREVKKFRTRLRKKKRQIPELKASQSPAAWNRKRLERLAKLEIKVIVVVAEKARFSPPQHPEDLYGLLGAQAVEECLQRFPSLVLCMDKRFTNPTLRAAQERALRAAVERPGRTLTIEQVDSVRDPAVQQADLVAWAFLQKYERGDASFVELIRDRVLVEKVLRGW